MFVTAIVSFLLLPMASLAAPGAIPVDLTARNSLSSRQARPPKPAPCQRTTSAPDATEAKERFDGFAKAFIYEQNITEAFTYIAQDYINHNPFAQNGFDSAWDILSPIWASQSITPLRTVYDHGVLQGWLNYRTGSFGEVVDRFRWEGGCIAEHWDQGETFPTRPSV